RCSNRCAKPVLPLGSYDEPTWYHTLTATTGALWSSCTTTVRPLGKVKRVYGSAGIALAALTLAGGSARAGTTPTTNVNKPASHNACGFRVTVNPWRDGVIGQPRRRGAGNATGASHAARRARTALSVDVRTRWDAVRGQGRTSRLSSVSHGTSTP